MPLLRVLPTTGIVPGGLSAHSISIIDSVMVNGKPATFRVKHYSDLGFDPKFHDVADSDLASFCEHPVDILEPLSAEETEYRRASLSHLRVLLAIDAYMTDSENPRLAWITVAVAFDLTSVRDLSLAEIANHLGVSPSALGCSTAKFRELAGLDATGSVHAIRDELVALCPQGY